MKSILVTFEDREHRMLIRAKKKMSWHDFILSSVKGGNK
jgi:hypothetical protein